ncbi:hypothetical protein CLV63_13210 [Murinocardiopsis flavida]|uniref:Uncharacterized protein n=1 Tax=Murinocardiopsis flavida TaxID=645275 RepID=A0A2P8CQV5_9ACTN|nr:hypothetical protein [Murinocardiopsis flavida]PSK87355.1 hypothetical protein CLV63_13210 [Murinocardiopsis flavida]
MAIMVVITGLILLGLAFGFLTAVSIGMKREDRRGGYRGLRHSSESGALSHSGRMLVNLNFRNIDSLADSIDLDELEKEAPGGRPDHRIAA